LGEHSLTDSADERLGRRRIGVGPAEHDVPGSVDPGQVSAGDVAEASTRAAEEMDDGGDLID
jgi:hypothetical protein